MDRASTYSTLTQAYAMLNLVGPANRGTKASIYILIGDGINRTLLLGTLGAPWRMYLREVVLHSTLLSLAFIWRGEYKGRE